MRRATQFLLFLLPAGALAATEGETGGRTSFEQRREALFAQHAGAYPSAGGSPAELRRERWQLARELELLAGTAPDSASRDGTLIHAIGFYFLAAVPTPSDPVRDSLRLVPGPAWEEYKRAAWSYVEDHPNGVNRFEIVIWLTPMFYFDEKLASRNVYGPEFWAPALELFHRSSNPAVRAQTGAYVVELCLLSDWELACRVAQETSEIERGAQTENRSDVELLMDAMHRTYDAFQRALGKTEAAMPTALGLHWSDHGEYPSREVLANEGRLWQALCPYLPEAYSRAFRSDPPVPEWLDLETNRLETVPGLRLAGVAEDVDASTGRAVPRLRFGRLYFEGYRGGSEISPWNRRSGERLEALRSRADGR